MVSVMITSCEVQYDNGGGYKTDTKEVLAAIPMDGGDAVCRNDVEFQIYNGTEPIFTETPGGIVLAENKFMIKMEGNNNEK